MLKLPSLKTLTYGLQQVIQRFPLVVTVAALKASALLFLFEYPQTHPQYDLVIRLTLLTFLALPLTLSLHLVAERRRWNALLLTAGAAGILLLLTLYFLTLAPDPIQRDYYRFGMFMACAHLLVSFAPFVGYNEPNGFWQFNKLMLMQLVTATLYAGTLYLGLIIAIETVKFLFDISFPFRIEADLLVLTIGFFHTLFFLNGFPLHLDILEGQSSYSRGVKVFTQYVLLPLVVVYLGILYLYIGKILVQWQLPEGGVAYLVMAFSVAGILALLLVYPLRESAGERWVLLFTRRFYLALFPLIILLWAGIYRRIQDYGITENRYLVAALAVWLAGISLYFLFSRKDDIRWIPLSLCVISFLLAVGPWSIFSVSRRAQASRFEQLLAEYKLLNSNRQLSGGATLSAQDYDQLVSGIRYFRSRRESDELRPYFTTLPQTDDSQALANAMEKQLSKVVQVTAETRSPDASLSYSLAGSDQGIEVPVRSFDFLWTLDFYGDRTMERGDWRIESSDQGARLSVFRNGTRLVTWEIAARLSELDSRYGSSAYELPPATLTFEHPQARLVLRSASWNGTKYSYQGVFMRKE